MRKLFLMLLLLLTACRPGGTGPTGSEPPTAEISKTSPNPIVITRPDPIQVYFTDPFAAGASQRKGGIDENIIRSIDSAYRSIDIAMLNLNLENFGDALVRARRRGVQVRLVMDSSSLDGNLPDRLVKEGIPVIGDRRESLMHNKFIIIDGIEVWTGSLNLTETGTYDDHNNVIQIHSRQIADDFTMEFNEMFVDDLFGDNIRPATPYPEVNIDGYRLEVNFSPDDGIQDRLIQLVQDARSSIEFIAFSFTADPLADAMIERSKSGVRVRGIFDSDQVDSNIGGNYEWMHRVGLDVRRDNLPGQMHDKFIIIDNRIVATGSYNFSKNAEKRNDENMVIIHDPQTAGLYLAEFEKIFASSE